MSSKKIEPKCKNCLLANWDKGICKVAILVEGEQFHMPIFPEDFCHMDELSIPVEQVRWFQQENKIKIEFPVGFFGPE
jgi:hypothetical protein